MNDVHLTKRARILLDELYREYTRRENQDVPRFQARLFGGADEIQRDLLQTWREDDIRDVCAELADNEMLEIISGDDDVLMLWLTDQGIAWAQTSGARKRAAFWETVGKIRSLLPW